MVETVTNRIFNPDGTVKPVGQATQRADVLSALAQELSAGIKAAGADVDTKSATANKAELHKVPGVTPVSPEVFVQEFKAALEKSPLNNFDGTAYDSRKKALLDELSSKIRAQKVPIQASPLNNSDGLGYDQREQALLAKLSMMIDAQEVKFDLNLSDDTSAQAVLEKVQKGLGAISPEYKALVTETVVTALKDNPGARAAFQKLMGYAKASTAILDEAKKDGLSAEDTAKLANLLQQAQPLEGVFGVLVANAFDAAKNLDVGALMKIFRGYVESLEGIVKPLVEKHMPTDLDKDPLKVAAQVQAPFENILTEYADKVGPVAKQVMDGILGFVKENAGQISKVASGAFAAFTTIVNRFQQILLPAPTKLTDILGISRERAAKSSLN